MPTNSQIKRTIHIGTGLAVLYLALFCQLPCGADFNARLDDSYFSNEFDWAVFIEMSDDKPYLSYPGSRLNPLTVLRVSAREFPETGGYIAPAQVYEEFWYHEHTPIGLRRFSQPNIQPDQRGVMVLGQAGTNSAAAAQVILRIMVELTVQKEALATVAIVPLNRYDQIVSELGHYSFYPGKPVGNKAQVALRIASNPPGKDNMYYRTPAN